ncbi:MAG TPA: biotin/lipoyl-containing protein [Pyrinomonadaceae bacterium]|nr:biotin/lipoyl-containing protein [Pyrinomonadaceae bacterium]
MKLKAHLSDREHEVVLDFASKGVIAGVDGRKFDFEVRELPDGVLLLIDGTKVYRCRVDPRQTNDEFNVTLQGKDYDVTIIDPKRLRSGQTAGAHGHGSAEIVSPMPGKVVRVLVAVGAEVEMGAGVIVVEAMKMQNELKAPKAGVVTSIKTAPGTTVNAGDVLAVIE